MAKKGPTSAFDTSSSVSGGVIRSAGFCPWRFFSEHHFPSPVFLLFIFFSERGEKKGQASQQADNCSVLTVCQVMEAQF